MSQQMNSIPDFELSEFTSINAIHALIAGELATVDELIHQRLSSDVVLINQIGHYIVNSGGKRLRPMLTLLSAGAHGYSGKDHIDLATIVEFIHTATLLHDDVVDDSKMRRGQETANEVWGNEASVLVGDFLYSRSFQMMVELKNFQVMEILADTTNTIAEGEVMQLINCHDPETTEDRYLATIRNKTAKLFEAACRLGVVISNSEKSQETAMATYGQHLGSAFQLIDDVLDYSADVDQSGKNMGDDLAEGKPTLPLLYAMWHGTPAQSTLIRRAIEQGGKECIEEVMSAIEQTGAIAYTEQTAKAEADKALNCLVNLPASPYKQALEALARLAVNRKS